MMDPKTTQSIYEEWIDRVFGTEFKRRALFGQSEDPFSHTVRSDLRKIVDLLFSEAPADGTLAVPEDLIRLRAVQEISAAEAVSHVFVLKDIVRERLGRDPGYERLSQRLDMVALHTFNAYAACRDALFRLRIREMAEYGVEETFACKSAVGPAVAPPRAVTGNLVAALGGAS